MCHATRLDRFATFASLLAIVGLALSGCADATASRKAPAEPSSTDSESSDEEVPEVPGDRERQLEDELDDVRSESKADRAGPNGFAQYRSTYKNMVVSGETAAGDEFALIAGTHAPDFPFYGDRPWDNGLLYLGGEGYHFTHRVQGRALALEIDTESARSTGRIRYDGEMKPAEGGDPVRVELSIPVRVDRHGKHQLGRPYAFLGGAMAEKFAGMRWRPYELEAGGGSISVANGPSADVANLHGEIEHGHLVNFKVDRFAFSYDYVSLAAPGDDGYTFIDFRAEPLDPSGVIGYLLDEYMKRFASATVTLDGESYDENIYDVDRPPQRDASVVLFENEVDLELAVLRRQMIRTRDARGNVLYGLREIFERK